MAARGWAIPPNGSLVERVPNPNPARLVIEMDDGEEYSVLQLHAHPRNVNNIAPTTLRVRLANGIRDFDRLFEKRLPRRKATMTRSSTSFNRAGMPL